MSAAFALFGGLFYASFFANLRSTVSEWTGSGFIWTVQEFHNFLHGRPFQSSFFASLAAGNSVGFTHNPYGFLHAFAIHVNFTPYAFAPLWALSPTPAWLYGLLIAWNLGAGLALIWLLAGPSAEGGDAGKAAFCGAILIAGGLLSILDQMAQFLLFIGPFLLALQWAVRARRRGLHLAFVVLSCLLAEDAAMVMLCWSAYAWLFEDEGRTFGRDAALFALPYLALVLLLIQPAARAELTLRDTTTTALVIKKLRELTPTLLAANLKSVLPALTLLPAFPLAAALFGVPERRHWVRLGALAVLPALLHWGESACVGGAHHLAPPFFALFLALIEAVRLAPGVSARSAAAWAWAGVFLALSFRVQAGNLPNGLRPRLYRLAGKMDKAAALQRSLAVEAASNRAVIAAGARVPPERGLVLWTNLRATGFLAARSDVWEFPEYFDQADFLLVQKDAVDLNFAFAAAGSGPLRPALEAVRRQKPNAREFAMDPATLRALSGELSGTHRVAYEDEHALLLENLRPVAPPSPPTTVGFGWVRNLPVVLGRYERKVRSGSTK